MMKIIIYITLIFLSIFVNAQELKKFEHWDDRYNNANAEEMAKTKQFLEKNNIEINKIINPTFGVCKYTLDSLPYIEYYSNDTLIYLMPGGMMPLNTSNLKLDENKKIKGNNNCYIEGIRKNGTISLRTPHMFSFLVKDKKLFAFVTYPSKTEKEKNEIILKIKKAETQQERDSLFKEYNNSFIVKPKLIFDLTNKNNTNDSIMIDNEKHSQIIDIYKQNGKKYYNIKLNFDPYRGRRDLYLTVDNDLNIVKLAEFILNNN